MKHDCPRYSLSDSGMPIHNRHVACWVCDFNRRQKYVVMMPLLPALHAFIEGDNVPDWAYSWLYEHFYDCMDYGTLTGDTGSIDEWLCDRPEYVEELAAEIEYACVELR